MYLPIRKTDCALCEKALDPRERCYVLPGCCICADCGEQPLDDIVSVLAERASVDRVTAAVGHGGGFGMARAIVAGDHRSLVAGCIASLAEGARGFAQSMSELTADTIEAQIDDAIGAAECQADALRALRDVVREGPVERPDYAAPSAEGGTTIHRDSGWGPNVD